MTSASLLAGLRCRGFRLWMDGDRPMIDPKSALTSSDRNAIKEHRAELIELLNDEWARTCPPAFDPLRPSSLGRMVQALEESDP